MSARIVLALTLLFIAATPNISLAQTDGLLVISVEPPGSELTIDGEVIPATREAVARHPVGPGTHLVTARWPNGDTARATIAVAAGETAVVELRPGTPAAPVRDAVSTTVSVDVLSDHPGLRLYHGDLRLRGAARWAELCESPCTLALARGEYLFGIGPGDARVVPVGTRTTISTAGVLSLSYEDRSDVRLAGVILAGIALGLGGAGLVVGVALFFARTGDGPPVAEAVTVTSVSGAVAAAGFVGLGFALSGDGGTVSFRGSFGSR